MPIYASSKSAGGGDGKPFELCPEGPQQAVCCDIIDHGVVMTRWGSQPKPAHKVTLRWQSKKAKADGTRYTVQKRYTLSLHEKATLRKDLQSWRGKPFSEEQAEKFDLEVLLGVNAFLNVGQRETRRGKFSEVLALMPVPKEYGLITVENYKRVKDRTAAEREPGDEHDEPGEPTSMEQIPPPSEEDKPPF